MKVNGRKVSFSQLPTSPSKADDSKGATLVDLAAKQNGSVSYPRELSTVRLLLVLHLVFHYAYQALGEELVESVFLQRLAEWGAVQYSTLFCLEGLILTIKYARTAIKTEGLDLEGFFKRHALEIYPIYLVACVAYWAFELVAAGVNNWSELFLSATLLKAWLPASGDLASKDPSWAVAAYIFFLVLFPAMLRLMLSASKPTLLQIMSCAWAATTFMPLTFKGFDLELGDAPHLFAFGATFPLMHAASFVFGMAMGLYLLKAFDLELSRGAASALLGTVVSVLLLAFFCSADPLDNRMQLWAYNGMLLPVTGLVLYLLAQGRDALLGALLRLKPLADTVGSIALTALVLQGFFVGLADYMVAGSLSTSSFWPAFWVMLLAASFFLHKIYSFIYVQHILPWLLAEGDAAKSQPEQAHVENPIRGWFWANNACAQVFRLVAYYGGMLAVVTFYMVLALSFDWKGFVSVSHMPWANAVVNLLKYSALISLPSLGFSMIGHVLFPPVVRVKNPSLETLKKAFRHRVFFRIVTRGKHPNLVRTHVMHAAAVLRSVLPFNQYCLEVATDNTLELEANCPGMAVELLVPKDYSPPGGCKFKARALQHAIEASAAEPGDWIVHLDEETRFDAETVRGILAHCVAEDEAIERGQKKLGNIGQGVILYGTEGEPDNWITTLADSVRVGDDFGKFRIQYELHEPLIGMHGSFVVCQNAVERLVTFDHGMEGSITEDAYFALVAQVKGVKFSWVDSFMYEQSPFSLNDFMHQRCRWFAGLWLIVLSRRLPLLNRAVLLFFMTTWAATPFIWLAMTLCMCVASSVPYWFRGAIGAISGMSTWGYLLGFMFTFRAEDGPVRFLVLLGLQLILQPFFAAMELSGVILGIVKPPTQGFHIVQKESQTLLKKKSYNALQQAGEAAAGNESGVELL